ncbi:MAG: type VI secretion system tube protein Hcp [Altererythrobacter sp.]|nr:type VI secretion system tube protein Hcp [Altererythrobacter sp.]
MKQAMMASGALALALVTSGPLSAAIYVKFPDIDGESETRGDSGDAHLDYLVITMSNAQENRTTPFETEDIGVAAEDDDHAAGDEHEIEYDIAAGALHSQGSHEAAHLVQQRAGTGPTTADKDHDAWIDVLSWGSAARPARAALRDAASGRATGKRQHKPVTVTKPIDKASPLRVPVDDGPGTLTLKQPMEGCTMGATYPHVLVGDDGVAGAEVTLERVTVTECSREHVSFTYQKVSASG